MSDEEKRGGRTLFRMLSQDLYRTNIHGEEVGIRQEEQWRSRSRQFTKDADIIGSLSEARIKDEGEHLPPLEKNGFIILRQSMWLDEPIEFQRRFVIKLFTESGGWLATMEEMIADSLAMSFAMDEPILNFAVVTEQNELVTYIRQMFRGSLSTETYGFFLVGPSGNFEVFRIEGKRASAGDDFKVILLSHRTEVAEIDSKFGDIGGEFVVKIKDEILARNEWFCRILQCFSVAIRYRIEMRERMKNRLERWEKTGEGHPQHRYEQSLLANPRKLTLNREEFEEV